MSNSWKHWDALTKADWKNAEISKEAAADPADTAAEILNHGENHLAIKAIFGQYKAVLAALKKGKEQNDHLNKSVGNGDINAPDFLKPVIDEIKKLEETCKIVSEQMRRRAQ